MRRRVDGSIQSGNVPTGQNLGAVQDNRLYRGMVIGRNYVDESNLTLNAQNPRVLYDVVLLGGLVEGQIITSCRLATDLANNSNFHERVLQPSTRPLNEVSLSDQDGDVVFLQFLQGDIAFPVITGLDNPIDSSGKIGATPENGVREIRQFNGVKTQTFKNGEHTFTRQSGIEQDGKFVENEGTPEYEIEYRDQELVTENFKSGLNIVKDGTSDKVTIATAGGVVVEADGTADKVTLTTAVGAVLSVDGPGGTITLTHGATVLTVDGLTGKISLTGTLIDIGALPADLAVLFTQLAANFNSHLHLHTSIPGTTPTTPPVAPLMPSVASATVTLQP